MAKKAVKRKSSTTMKKGKKSAPKKKAVKKKAARKPVHRAAKAVLKKKPAVKRPMVPVPKALPVVGKVIHYYDQISVGVVHVDKPLRVHDKIRIGKQDRFFEQEIKSMQVNRQPISEAKKGQEVGLKVKKRVRQNDLVWKA